MESRVAFPASRRPLYHLPTVRMKHGITQDQMLWWVNKIDQIVDRRTDRKGILHTVSYKRAEFFLQHTRHLDIAFLPPAISLRDAVAAFKGDTDEFRRGQLGGAIRDRLISGQIKLLISPALSTGFDFPGDSCRYQIIGKVPFPDTRSKVLKAREKIDKDYGPYVAMQQIVQMCGRGMRSADDWCENFIIDDNWTWFITVYKGFAPAWFLNGCRFVNSIPPPLDVGHVSSPPPLTAGQR